MKFGSGILKALFDLYIARHEPETLRSLTEFFWRTCLVIAILCCALILFAGFWQFALVLNDLNTPPSGNSSPPPVLNRAQLEKVLSDYNARKSHFESLKSNRTPVVDPSKK